MIGIYKITNPIGQVYIGQSKNIKNRFLSHRSGKRAYNPKLKDSFGKYGIDNHVFEIIEECNVEDLNTKERHYQLEYSSINFGLNSRLQNDEESLLEYLDKESVIFEIQSKFLTIQSKKEFIELIASKFKKQPLSIQNNWLGRYFAIPKQHQIEVLDFINNYLKHHQ